MIWEPDAVDREPSDPTPEQIRLRAAKVREGWSLSVKVRRRVTLEETWMPPLVMTIELVRAMNSKSE